MHQVDAAAKPEVAASSLVASWQDWAPAMFTGEIGRGDSARVFGCGGVGCAAIAAARWPARRSDGVDIVQPPLMVPGSRRATAR